MDIIIIILLAAAAAALAFSVSATVKIFKAFSADFPAEQRADHIKKYRRRMIISYGVTMGLIAAAVALKLMTK